ncbi:putative membrane protein [Paenibacillus riograndensis SBR5]|uniref:Putative membrane protein n=1 Tax=Paenibacillus riograndensis SBR5 TaxID=1073571 RepID=A0A0E4CUL0_9BACL|nr:putative membrane protein [Paenibacillus riograndensis SBR5]
MDYIVEEVIPISGLFKRVYRSCIDNPWPLALFVLGAIVRIIYLGSIPSGLNQDEASIGYDAYAILHYGIDRNGVHLPIHLIAWGSGQNALYAYLSMPFIWLFGLTPLSVRALSLVMGLVGMIFFYLSMRQLFPARAGGIFAMFFIAINPWHIMMSRWALESNLFPTLILIAVYCLLKSFQTPKWSYGFTVIMAISLYAYGTAYFFVPVFAICAAFLLLYSRVLKFRTLVWNTVFFVLLALPILLFIVINHYGFHEIATRLFTIPRLTMPRVEQISSVFGGELLHTASSNFSRFIELLRSGSDGLPWNAISPYGYAYPIALPFALLGLIVMIYEVYQRRREGLGYITVLLWLGIAILMALITDVNINRINIIFYPLIMLVATAVFSLYQKLKLAALLSVAVFAVMFGFFTNAYFGKFPKEIGPAFYDSLGEAIQYASETASGDIYVTDKVNMPYIYVLFYEKINPHDFLASVKYINPGDAFQMVSSFGRYKFGAPGMEPGQAAYVFGNNDPVPAVNSGYTIKKFTNYSVLIYNNTEGNAAPYVEGVQAEVPNGGFEEGTSGWSFSTGTGAAGNNPYSGAGHAYLDIGSDKSIQQTFSARTGIYKLTAMVSAGGSGGRIGIRVNGSVRAEAELTAGDEYHPVALPDASLKQGEQAEIYITGGNGWINIDEVRLER